MQTEREELVKQVFPQLRKLCETRGAVWGEVDLRWGITEEQKAEGRVLPICLEEIQRCRPYFIGLLGGRYGWVPEQIPAELIEREPWLADHRHHSVTEMEILHGVLNDPGMAGHAFFYFRDPSYLNRLPEAEQKWFREEPTDEEIAALGPEEARARAEERRAKLSTLKARIRALEFPVRENYPNPQELGRLVLADMTEIINRLFPEAVEPLDRENLDHEAFARSRGQIYIGRPEYFSRLDEHIEGSGLPLVVIGESGSGKSALLANWALGRRARTPERRVLAHFVGASPSSSDWASMLRRLLMELARMFGFTETIPDQPDTLRAAFLDALVRVAAKNKVVLVIDGLDRLEDKEGALDLVWLPPRLPAQVQLIVSTLPGRPLDEIHKRGWPTLEIKPLDFEERKRFITDYLAQYAKSLGGPQSERLALSKECANPLFLKALLEELRVFGVHEKLDARIAHYLEAGNVSELYEKILARYEEDYDGERPGLVRDSMTMIWASRRGLSESELLDLLGIEGRPLPHAAWSTFSLAAEQTLLNRSGYLTFSHDFFRRAVVNRYLHDEGARISAHLCLADYFAPEKRGPRRLEELPWQLGQAASWDRLSGLLSDPAFFGQLWLLDDYQARVYWAQVEANSDQRATAAYEDMSKNLGRHAWHDLIPVTRLLRAMGHLREASELSACVIVNLKSAIDRGELSPSIFKTLMRRSGGTLTTIPASKKRDELLNSGTLACTMIDSADMAISLGEWDKALSFLREAERTARQIEAGIEGEVESEVGARFSRTLRADALTGQAIIHKRRGDLGRALALYQEAEAVYLAEKNPAGRDTCVFNQACLFEEMGELDRALEFYQRSERTSRELGDREAIARAVRGQAIVFERRGDWEKALAVYAEDEKMSRELGDQDSVAAAIDDQAVILREHGDFDGAVARNREAVQIFRELGNKLNLVSALHNRGNLMRNLGNFDEAMTAYKEEERLARALDAQNHLARSLEGQASLLMDRGESPRALPLLEEGERICRRTGSRLGLAQALYNQSVIHHEQGASEASLKIAREAECLFREERDKEGLANAVGQQAATLLVLGRWDEALGRLEEQAAIGREIGIADGVAASLLNQAHIHFERGDGRRAASLLAEVEPFRKRIVHRRRLQRFVHVEAMLLKEMGFLDQALARFREEEAVSRALKDSKAAAEALANQALITGLEGKAQESIRLFQEATLAARQANDGRLLAQITGQVAQVLMKLGDLNSAQKSLREQERLCRELRNEDGLAECLTNLGVVHYMKEEFAEALKIHEESEVISRRLCDDKKVAVALGNQAIIHYNKGRNPRAMELHKEEEGIYLRLGDREGLQRTYGNQALVLKDLKDFEKSLALFAEQEKICREIGQRYDLAGCLARQAEILMARKRLNEAAAKGREAVTLAIELGIPSVLQWMRDLFKKYR